MDSPPSDSKKTINVVMKVNRPAIDCHSKSCKHIKECAQHDSAGDFRAESGDSPELWIRSTKGIVYCKQSLIGNETGAWYFRQDGTITNEPWR